MTNQPNVYFKDPVTGEEYIGVPELDLTVELVGIIISVMTFPIAMTVIWYSINGVALNRKTTVKY
jgi:hypothetical protein